MYRRNINIKPKCGQQTGKALSNHESFSPSQSHDTVPLMTMPLEPQHTRELLYMQKYKRAISRNTALPLDQTSGWPDEAREELGSKEADFSRTRNGQAGDPAH
jgi:hypothetical protein